MMANYICPSKIFKRFAIVVFALGGGYYLWMQHRAHVLQYLPFAIFLLCPLMHLFHGHGKHEHSGSGEAPQNKGGCHA